MVALTVPSAEDRMSTLVMKSPEGTDSMETVCQIPEQGWGEIAHQRPARIDIGVNSPCRRCGKARCAAFQLEGSRRDRRWDHERKE